MGDVAQILSGAMSQAQSSSSSSGGPIPTTKKKKLAPPPLPPSHVIPKSLKQVSISKQPMAIITASAHPEDVASASLPPMAPSTSFPTNTDTSGMKKRAAHNTKINKKYITMSSNRKAKLWTWAPFTSSARTDGLMLNHWVRAGVEYPDYPYARFNIQLQPLSYKDDTKSSSNPNGRDVDNCSVNSSYEKLGLADDANWTQSETDMLLDLCRIHELRWPVIIDRWIGIFGDDTNKKVEDLQHRYYTIGMILNRKVVEQVAKTEADCLTKAISASNQSSNILISPSNESLMSKVNPIQDTTLVAERALANAVVASAAHKHSNTTATLQPPIAKLTTGTSNQMVFDLHVERRRRQYLEDQWNRSKEEEKEEADLLKELELIDAQIRKLKKNGGHLLPSGILLNSAANSLRPTPLSSRVPSPTNTLDDMNALNFPLSTTPMPTAGTPYLQSGRLGHPGPDHGISKSMLKQMDQILKEIGVRERPLPTKRVCDLYDNLRRDVIALLTLQKIMLKAEAEVVSKRLKLDKLTGASTVTQPTGPMSGTKSLPSSSTTKPSPLSTATSKKIADDATSSTNAVKKEKATSSRKKSLPDAKANPNNTSNAEDLNTTKMIAISSTTNVEAKVKTKKVSGTKRKPSAKTAESVPPSNIIPTWTSGLDPVNNPLPPNDFMTGSVASPLFVPPKSISAPKTTTFPVPLFNSGGGFSVQAVPTPIKFGSTFNPIISSVPHNETGQIPTNPKPKKRSKKNTVAETGANSLKQA